MLLILRGDIRTSSSGVELTTNAQFSSCPVECESDVRSLNIQGSTLNSDAASTLSNSSGGAQSPQNYNASSSSAPFLAAVPDSSLMDNDFKSPNSLIDRPMAPKFKKRGRRAGKARDATANCSSGCTSIIK